jgi:hypothetical protein
MTWSLTLPGIALNNLLSESIIYSTQVPGYILEFKTCIKIHFQKSSISSLGIDDCFCHDSC